MLFEAALVRRSLLGIFSSEVTRSFSTVIHVAAIHLRDMELIDEIMDMLFLRMPHHVHAELIKELLTGM